MKKIRNAQKQMEKVVKKKELAKEIEDLLEKKEIH
jgi:hypothetical protein